MALQLMLPYHTGQQKETIKNSCTCRNSCENAVWWIGEGSYLLLLQFLTINCYISYTFWVSIFLQIYLFGDVHCPASKNAIYATIPLLIYYEFWWLRFSDQCVAVERKQVACKSLSSSFRVQLGMTTKLRSTPPQSLHHYLVLFKVAFRRSFLGCFIFPE